jgi:hypothetical protein
MLCRRPVASEARYERTRRIPCLAHEVELLTAELLPDAFGGARRTRDAQGGLEALGVAWPPPISDRVGDPTHRDQQDRELDVSRELAVRAINGAHQTALIVGQRRCWPIATRP